MPEHQPKRPVETPWRNGPTYPFGSAPTVRPKTVTDFAIALERRDTLGVFMEWRSLALGLLTPFDYYGHLEEPDRVFLDAQDEPRRLSDGWRPVGTATRPYIDLEQGYVFSAWADDRFVYVEYGDEEPEPFVRTWYRVPVLQFDEAWASMLRRLSLG